MGKPKPLSGCAAIKLPDGTIKPICEIDDLSRPEETGRMLISKEELEEYKKLIFKHVGEVMSDYYSAKANK